jgi:hypothetical protein
VLSDSWPFEREATVPNDDVECYQLTSHQLDLPLVLLQDSITGFESVGLEPILQKCPLNLLGLFCHKVGGVKCTNSAITNMYTVVQPDRRANVNSGKPKGTQVC